MREDNLQHWQKHENEVGVVHRELPEMLSLPAEGYDEWTVPNFWKMLKMPAPEPVWGWALRRRE